MKKQKERLNANNVDADLVSAQKENKGQIWNLLLQNPKTKFQTLTSNAKGITLIALIITIIVMLILVGVTINVALNGGLFGKAIEAVNKTEEEKEKELIQVGYSDYCMQEYSPQKTDDFDMLESYFLGEKRQGLDINTLVDNEKSDEEEGIIVFKDVDITIIEEDLEFSEDEKYCYIHFEYKNHKYKLTCNSGNQMMTQKLEVEPTLQVQDAVVKEETDGWNIVFTASGNSYDLLHDGRIVNAWWKLTEEESKAISSYDDAAGGYIIAKGDNYQPYVALEWNKDAIYIINSGTVYVFALTDDGKQRIEDLSYVSIDKYKWYYGTDNIGSIENCKEYKGNSPISSDDFKNEEIICKSYLEKIINSFEN